MEDLPLGVALDGELWMGRNKFEKLMALLHTSSQDDPWKEVMYVIFDMPHSNETYELRMEALNKIKLPSHAKIVSRIQCQGNDHLLKITDRNCKRRRGRIYVVQTPITVHWRANAIIIESKGNSKCNLFIECRLKTIARFR